MVKPKDNQEDNVQQDGTAPYPSESSSTTSPRRSKRSSPARPAFDLTDPPRRDYRSEWQAISTLHPRPSPSDSQASRTTRINSTHIFFWKGPLSNWNMGPQYSGKECFEMLIPRLRDLDVEVPATKAFSTQLLIHYQFKCGEQWMMALKGWLFERDLDLGEQQFSWEEFGVLRDGMMKRRCSFLAHTREHAFYFGTLCKILRTSSPRDQKGLGRAARNFNPKIWDKASIPIVTACSVVRAEADPELGGIYERSGTRKFVEGSPLDYVWGVGLKWDDERIDDERNWLGENRLGRCHDEARKIYMERKQAKSRREQYPAPFERKTAMKPFLKQS